VNIIHDVVYMSLSAFSLSYYLIYMSLSSLSLSLIYIYIYIWYQSFPTWYQSLFSWCLFEASILGHAFFFFFSHLSVSSVFSSLRKQYIKCFIDVFAHDENLEFIWPSHPAHSVVFCLVLL
jgi:hypothetical protein